MPKEMPNEHGLIDMAGLSMQGGIKPPAGADECRVEWTIPATGASDHGQPLPPKTAADIANAENKKHPDIRHTINCNPKP